MRRPAPLRGFCAVERRAHRAEERRPRADLAAVASPSASGRGRRGRGPRACAKTSVAPRLAGMLGIALDLGRPALVALDQQAGARRRRAASPSRRTAACPGSSSSGCAHVGHDLLGRLPRAAGDAGQRQRRAHQLQERRGASTGSVHSRRLRRGTRGAATPGTPASGQLLEAAPELLPPAARRARIGRAGSFMRSSVARRATGELSSCDLVFLHQPLARARPGRPAARSPC